MALLPELCFIAVPCVRFLISNQEVSRNLLSIQPALTCSVIYLSPAESDDRLCYTYEYDDCEVFRQAEGENREIDASLVNVVEVDVRNIFDLGATTDGTSSQRDRRHADSESVKFHSGDTLPHRDKKLNGNNAHMYSKLEVLFAVPEIE